MWTEWKLMKFTMFFFFFFFVSNSNFLIRNKHQLETSEMQCQFVQNMHSHKQIMHRHRHQKGIKPKTQVDPNTQKICKYFDLHCSFNCSKNIYTKEAPFCFKSEFLRAQPCWFTLYQWRAEKDWLMRYLILLPHMLALFHSLTQTAGHKMAALTVMFS